MIRLSATLFAALFIAFGCAKTPGGSHAPSAWINAESELIEVAGTELHLRDQGAMGSEAIMFLHGFGSSLHSWEAVDAGLQTEFRTISFDLPGFGLSAADALNDYTDERVHEIIIAIMHGREIDSVSIVGHSLGGRVAWSFAAAHPDKVTSVVLIAPDGYESPMFQYGQAGRVTPLTRLIILVLPRFVVRWALNASYGQIEPTAETVARYHSLLRQSHVKRAILERTRQTILEDPDKILPGIGVPVLLVWGAQDRIAPASNAEDFLDALPNARLNVLAGVGHLPQEEAPNKLIELMAEFFERQSPE